MASLNKVILIGNLGADPESRYLPNGDAVVNLRLATTDTYKDKASGERREVTEWHRVVMFRRLAEIATQYLKKGSQIYIEGRIKTRKWQDQSGQERYTTEIEATEMKMLGGRRDSAGGGDYGNDSYGGGDDYSQAPAPAPRASGGGAPRAPAKADPFTMDDDIPF